MYAIIESNEVLAYPAGLAQLQAKFPFTSFPKPLSAADLTEYGYVSVEESERPSFNAETSYLEEGTPTKSGDKWVKVWTVKNLSTEQIAEKAQQKTNSARSLRDVKLAETDYLALSDATLTDEMRTYRQALRDVPAQSGFPDNITWPTKP